MKTLTTNVSTGSKKQGSRPRFFVRIPDADLFLATKAQTDSGSAEAFVDTIERLGTISERIDRLGGMSSVSGLDMSNLVLGQRLTLATEAERSPKYTVQSGQTILGAGRLVKAGAYGDTYLDVRNATTASSFSTVLIVVGRTYSPGSEIFTNYRGFLHFDVPAGITTCEEAVIPLPGNGDASATDFELYLIEGNWSSLDTGTFNDFDGWASSGAYTAEILNEPWESSEFQSGTNYIRLNEAGRNLIVANSGGSVKFILLSKKDYANSADPSGNEYVQFDAISATLTLRYNSKKLDNKEVEIYLDYEPVATTYTGMQLIRKFIIDDYAVTDSTLDLVIKDNNFKHDPEIPRDIVTKEDYPYCSSENIGKPIPILYGDFTSVKEFREHAGYFTEETNDTICSGGECFRGLLVDTVYNYFLFASHALKEIADFMMLWDGGLETYTIIPCIVTNISTGKYGISKGTDDADFPYYMTTEDYPNPAINPIIVKIPYMGGTDGIIDYTNSQNNDPSDWATINSHSDYLILNSFDMSWGVSGMFDTMAFVIETFALNGYGDSNCIKFRHGVWKDDNTELQIVEEHITSNGQHVYVLDHAEIPNSKVNTIIGIYGQQWQEGDFLDGFDPNYPIKFRNVCIVRGFSAGLVNKIYALGQGKADDVSGTVTGTPSSLIECPSHVIESFARDEMNLAAADINTTSFDTAAVALGAWEYAFQILDRNKAHSHLDALAQQCRSRVFWDYSDTLKMVTFSATANFSVSGTDVPSGLDIFDATGSPSGGSFTTNPILPNSLRIGRVSLDDVFNDFILRYRKNYASGNFDDVLYMDNGLGTAGSVATNLDEANLECSWTLTELATLCADSYTTFGSTRTLTYEATHIRDEATASKLLQYLIERTSQRWYTATIQTLFTAVSHELGDIINIRDDRVDDLFGAATAYYKKWEIIGLDTNQDSCEITVTAIEV